MTITGVRLVTASGDTTGVSDVAAIQGAIDALQAETPQYGLGVVVLSGYYYVNAMLTLGAPGVDTRVAIVGAGLAVIKRRAAAGSAGYRDYCIKVYDGYSGNRTVLKNLRLFCEYLCRGILLAGVEEASLEDVQVYNSIETGIDCVSGWRLMFRNVSVQYFRGYALRTYQANACHFDSFMALMGYAFYSTNQTTITDSALANYAMITGGYTNFAAWDAGTKAVTDIAVWPAADDESATDLAGTGTGLELSAAYRAAIYHCGIGSTFTNLTLEECHFVDYPLIFINGSSHNYFTSMYLETNKNMFSKVRIAGGSFNEFHKIVDYDADPLGHDQVDVTIPQHNDACVAFAELTGTTIGNLIERLCGNTGLTDHIMLLNGGVHTGNIVRECHSKCGEISSANWIGEVNTPTVEEEWSDGVTPP